MSAQEREKRYSSSVELPPQNQPASNSQQSPRQKPKRHTPTLPQELEDSSSSLFSSISVLSSPKRRESETRRLSQEQLVDKLAQINAKIRELESQKEESNLEEEQLQRQQTGSVQEKHLHDKLAQINANLLELEQQQIEQQRTKGESGNESLDISSKSNNQAQQLRDKLHKVHDKLVEFEQQKKQEQQQQQQSRSSQTSKRDEMISKLQHKRCIIKMNILRREQEEMEGSIGNLNSSSPATMLTSLRSDQEELEESITKLELSFSSLPAT